MSSGSLTLHLFQAMPRLVLLTPAELTRDPRARRAAAAGLAAGWEVVGVCAAAGGVPVALDGVDVLRVGGERLDSALRAAGLGGGRRDRPVTRELRGLYRLLRLIRMTLRVWHVGRTLGHANVVHANDFDTLPAGRLLAHTLRARLVYDAHELYTLQEVDPPRLHATVTHALERALAQRADAVVTVSEPIAHELQSLLGLRQTPLVVLNCPARTERAASADVGYPLRAVYQGAVGLGRSIDDLFEAAESTSGVELTLRIVGVDPVHLRNEVRRRGLDGRVTVLEPVDPGELVDSLTTFDVGVIATRPLTRNDELAAPNKLFEYLMAGLAVAVPDLRGVAAIVEAEGVGVTFEAGSPASLGRALTRLASDPVRVAAAKARARSAALTRFNAEAQRAALAKAWSG
jgi:glycosyltransferase involved in cell wall biosynthesis